MYSATLLDHFHHPRNVGELESASVIAEVSNPVCGDLMKLWAVIRDGRIQGVTFKVAGCVPAVASASWLTEAILSRSIEELSVLTPDEIISGLCGMPPASRHAAVLAIDALRTLLKQIGE
jgi:nitrogen fixation protein NifU and related proteins